MAKASKIEPVNIELYQKAWARFRRDVNVVARVQSNVDYGKKRVGKRRRVVSEKQKRHEHQGFLRFLFRRSNVRLPLLHVFLHRRAGRRKNRLTAVFLSPLNNSLSEGRKVNTMFRIAIAPAIFAALIVFGSLSAFAQSDAPKPKYPAEIVAASRLLAEKDENCRLQVKQQKLTFLKRRSFIRECRHR